MQEISPEPVTYCYLDSIINLEEFLGNVGIVAVLKNFKEFSCFGVLMVWFLGFAILSHDYVFESII